MFFFLKACIHKHFVELLTLEEVDMYNVRHWGNNIILSSTCLIELICHTK